MIQISDWGFLDQSETPQLLEHLAVYGNAGSAYIAHGEMYDI
jgi:hypothetical protein